MSRSIVWTSQFKKDYKLVAKRGLPVSELDDCIRLLASGEEIPSSYLDHALIGNWSGHRECHLRGDWLMIYRLEDNDLVLVLVRSGSHSDLF